MEYGIIADDLTGACDAVAPFAIRQRATHVSWLADSIVGSRADVVSICTSTRDVSPATAVAKSRRAARLLKDLGAHRLFKKMDSTFKGNIGQEVHAVLEESGLVAAVIAAAFPSMGRYVIDGKLCPKKTRNPRGPSLKAILESQHDTNVLLISSSDVSRGPLYLARLIKNHCQEHPVILVDSVCDLDLDFVAGALEILADSILPVGSAGLATSVARQLSLSKLAHPMELGLDWRVVSSSSEASPGASVALFVGSTNERTQQQVAEFVESSCAAIIELDDDAENNVLECLRCEEHFVVKVPPPHAKSATLMAVLQHCRQVGLAGLVMTGGDTALAICDLCGANGLRVGGEIERGIPCGTIVGGMFDGVPFVSKAGGFGRLTSLVHAVDCLVEWPGCGSNVHH
jgi:uncharacterized protein YgbK (DUF1537 family)